MKATSPLKVQIFEKFRLSKFENYSLITLYHYKNRILNKKSFRHFFDVLKKVLFQSIKLAQLSRF